jgi:hypothetical protein
MVLATSGLTGDGVVEGIDWVAQSIVRNVHVRQGGGIRDRCSAHVRRPCISDPDPGFFCSIRILIKAVAE